MRMNDIIENKKLGRELGHDEIAFFVKGFTCGDIPDYQAAALAMAIRLNGMTDSETAILTHEMAKSGDCLDLSSLGNATVDKHSSGGVGDKTTLIVAPIAAAAGAVVAKMSGRGLGFTGGTIDKLESIKGFNTALSSDDFLKQAKQTGLVIAGQTGNMAPCDKKLYALRDVTATVDSLPLIASSIMSKKIASGAKNIVLDVKCGNGAFMKTQAEAAELARQMVAIGASCERNVSALITDMSTPLGYAIGNALEVKEAIDVLQGRHTGDLCQICIALAAEMMSMALNMSIEEAEQTANKMLLSGKAYDKFSQMVKAQGGDIKSAQEFDFDNTNEYRYELKAENSGYISHLDALLLGEASVILGAGRNIKSDSIDCNAGIMLSSKPGDCVQTGDTVMTLYAGSTDRIQSALGKCKSSFDISGSKPGTANIIKQTIRNP